MEEKTRHNCKVRVVLTAVRWNIEEGCEVQGFNRKKKNEWRRRDSDKASVSMFRGEGGGAIR